MVEGGPNNQYQQFLECAVIARALGRRIVTPPFARWHEDGSGRFVRAFADTFVSAVEDATKEMFGQVAASLDRGLAAVTARVGDPGASVQQQQGAPAALSPRSKKSKSIKDIMLQLNELVSAGLLTPTEYAEKKEILLQKLMDGE